MDIGRVSGPGQDGLSRSPDSPVGFERGYAGDVSLGLRVGAGIISRARDKVEMLFNYLASAQRELRKSPIYQIDPEMARERVREMASRAYPGSPEWYRLQTALQIRYRNFDLARLDTATFEARLPTDPWDDVDPDALALTLTRGARPMLGPQFIHMSPEQIVLPPPNRPPSRESAVDLSEEGDTQAPQGAGYNPQVVHDTRRPSVGVADPTRSVVSAADFVSWLGELASDYKVSYIQPSYVENGVQRTGGDWMPSIPAWGIGQVAPGQRIPMMTGYQGGSLPIHELTVGWSGNKLVFRYKDRGLNVQEFVEELPPSASKLPKLIRSQPGIQMTPVPIILRESTKVDRSVNNTIATYAKDAQVQILEQLQSFLESHSDVQMRYEVLRFTVGEGKVVYKIAPVLVGKTIEGKQVKRYFITGAKIGSQEIPFIWAYTLAVLGKDQDLTSAEAETLGPYHAQLLRLLGFSPAAADSIAQSIKAGQSYDLTVKQIRTHVDKEFKTKRRVPIPFFISEVPSN